MRKYEVTLTLSKKRIPVYADSYEKAMAQVGEQLTDLMLMDFKEEEIENILISSPEAMPASDTNRQAGEPGKYSHLSPDMKKLCEALDNLCLDSSCEEEEIEEELDIQPVKLLEFQHRKLAHMLPRNRLHRFRIAVKLFLAVGGNRHGQQGEHHALVAGRQVIEKFFGFLALQFHVVRDNGGEIVVGVLTALPVGDIRLHAEQTVFHLPHRFIGRNRYNVNRQHHIAVKIGQFRHHTVLDIRSIVFEKQHPAVFIAQLQIIAVFLHGIGADIVPEVMPLFHHVVRVKMEIAFFTLPVKIMQDTQFFLCVQFGAFGTERRKVGDQVSPHTGEIGPRFLNILFHNRNRQVFFLRNPIRAGRFKLTNYLRFWQASGESKKTSIRIKNSMEQMEISGLYTGGAVKYGYHLIESRLVNKKGQPIKKYEIDEAEAEVLHMIDDMTVHKGYGSWRLADYLNKHGYKTHNGGKFTSMKIIRILRDPYYCGRLENGETSEALQKLKIRNDDTYNQILYILRQRNRKNEEKRHIAMSTKGNAMLSGNIFCAHCGGRLTTIRYRDSYIRTDGSVYAVDQIKYSCYHKSRKLCECDGQTTYQADRVDEVVSQIIRKIFSCMQGAPEEEKLQMLFKRQMAGNRATQKKLSLELEKNKGQLLKLQLEIGKTLTGDSIYSPEDLTQAIQTLKLRVADVEMQLGELQEEEAEKKRGIDLITPAYNQFKSWADEFDTATLEQKKMIACQLFKRVEVGRDYQISVELNMTYQQFCSEWDSGLFIKSAV